MKKIDIKKPRYALPVICLPFILLFFYVYKSSFGKEKVVPAGVDSLQTNLANVSGQVQNERLSGKLDAFRNKFKQADGYTAVGSITEETLTQEKIGSSYNEQEKRMLDSIDQVMKRRHGNTVVSSGPAPFLTSPGSVSFSKYQSQRNQDQALATALAKIKERESSREVIREARQNPDPMQLFRAQMALVDSMGKANDPVQREQQALQRQRTIAEQVERNRKRVPVRKVSEAALSFNTIMASEDERPIAAIIDQDITGFSGSRLRIRLTDDIMVGKSLIKKGTYLFATISGFSSQRVSLVVSSVFYGGEILPVNLQVYDNDGLAGIYVPASAFREFSRDLGGSTSQGISIQQVAENNNQLVMSVLSKMFQSTTTAVNKLIRSNKVKLKYNTQVYLIDPDELKRKQQSY